MIPNFFLSDLTWQLLVLLLLLRLFQISSVFCVNVHLRLLRLSRSSHMGGSTFFTNKVPMVRFLCLIFSLVPSNVPLTRGTETKKAEQFQKKKLQILYDKIEQNSNFAKCQMAFYYRLFFLRLIAQFFKQISMNCFVSS